MSRLCINQRILKPIPFPLECDIIFKMGKWKYARMGRIICKPLNLLPQYYFYPKKGEKDGFYHLSPYNLYEITILNTNEKWDIYL